MGWFGRKDATTRKPTRDGWMSQCGPDCGFLVKDHDKLEAIEMVKLHLKRSHKTNLTDAEAAASLTPTTL